MNPLQKLTDSPIDGKVKTIPQSKTKKKNKRNTSRIDERLQPEQIISKNSEEFHLPACPPTRKIENITNEVNENITNNTNEEIKNPNESSKEINSQNNLPDVLNVSNQEKPNESIREKLAKLSREIDVLKEQVKIYNESFIHVDSFLKKEGIVTNTQRAQAYYIYHRETFNNLKTSLSEIKEGLNHRIMELEKKQSILTFEEKPELKELNTRKKRIEIRISEVHDLLEARKIAFNLKEKEDMDTKDLPQLEDFSSNEYKCLNDALNLMQQVTALKEDVALENEWESSFLYNQRCQNYSIIEKQIENFIKEESELKTRKDERTNVINQAIAVYQRYITTIQVTMGSTKNLFSTLSDAICKMNNWKDPSFYEEKRNDQQTNPTDLEGKIQDLQITLIGLEDKIQDFSPSIQENFLTKLISFQSLIAGIEIEANNSLQIYNHVYKSKMHEEISKDFFKLKEIKKKESGKISEFFKNTIQPLYAKLQTTLENAIAKLEFESALLKHTIDGLSDRKYGKRYGEVYRLNELKGELEKRKQSIQTQNPNSEEQKKWKLFFSW